MRQKEQLPDEGYYKLLVISQAEGEIVEYKELFKKSIFDEIVSAQNDIISAVELLRDLCLPEETVDRFRESARSMSLDELRKSVVSYHFARFRDLPDKPLAAKEKQITLSVRLAKGLKISGPEIVRTIISETPPGKMDQWLYRQTQDGTVTVEEAEELAQEFHLK